MNDVIRMSTGQMDHGFSTRITETAKEFGVKAKVSYEGMTFSWPLNTKHFRVAVEGETEAVERFKKFVIDEDDDSIVVPLIFGGIAIAAVSAFVLFI